MPKILSVNMIKITVSDAPTKLPKAQKPKLGRNISPWDADAIKAKLKDRYNPKRPRKFR